MHYFDASALVKRYVREKGTSKVRRLISSDAVATSRLSEVEIVSGLARRMREDTLSGEEFDRAMAAIKADFTKFLVVELAPEITSRACVLLRSHGLRAGDAVQLASCLQLQDELGQRIPLVAFDARLIEVARAEALALA